ncbi:MAG: hypothetical protein ACK5B9_11525 [Flavobacteriia bacterium]|jgi:hypothetical protein
MGNKLYLFSFKVKDKRMPDGFNWIGLADRSLLSLATRVKIKGFKKGMEFKTNLSIIECCELLENVFPPKKKKNPIEGTLSGIDELIKPFPDRKPLFDKDSLSKRIEELSGDEKCVTVKRQPTFFCKNTKVSNNELKKFFTDKAIRLMFEDGYLDYEATFPIAFGEGWNKENAFKPIDFEELALDSFKQLRQSIKEMNLGDNPICSISTNRELCINEKTEGEITVCDSIENYLSVFKDSKSEVLDIYLSKKLYKELCESFGGKVKKYKGHKIIVR